VGVTVQNEIEEAPSLRTKSAHISLFYVLGHEGGDIKGGHSTEADDMHVMLMSANAKLSAELSR
jgi:hypothetical protein